MLRDVVDFANPPACVHMLLTNRCGSLSASATKTPEMPLIVKGKVQNTHMCVIDTDTIPNSSPRGDLCLMYVAFRRVPWFDGFRLTNGVPLHVIRP